MHIPVTAIDDERAEPGTEVLMDHWAVSDQFDFENVGVSKAIDVNFRYLICADCDAGPIGIVNKNVEGATFFVSHSRVKYL